MRSSEEAGEGIMSSELLATLLAGTLVSSAYAGSSDGPRYDHGLDHRGSGGYSGYGADDGYRGNDGYRGPGGYDRYRGYQWL